MEYKKPALTIAKQIAQLKERGLIIENDSKTAHHLSNINYYRLRAYTYPFQNKDAKQHFKPNISFDEILELYVFDRKLRIIFFDAIEKIEIALRTTIIYEYAICHGSHWHLQEKRYKNKENFAKHLKILEIEVERSQEKFIKHYTATYTEPIQPPCWASLEISSMGLLSKLFKNLLEDECKKKVTQHFGLNDPSILENWLHCFVVLRNICAHHSRIWNRRLVTPMVILKKAKHPYIYEKNILPYKIYAYLVNIQYCLNIISPGHNIMTKVSALLNKYPTAQAKDMGFPTNWQQESFFDL